MNQQKIESRALELISAAMQRWLVKDELVFLLLHYKLLGIPIHTKVQIKPTSGAILFYDIGVATDYKKDGWKWQRRKDGSGRVREDRAKLVINREVIVLGSYVHSSEITTFHRRSYSLRGSDQNIVLVHYFDEVHKINRNQHLNHPHAVMKRKDPTESSENPLVQGLSSLKTTLNKNETTNEESIDSIMKSCFEMDYAPANLQIYDPHFNNTSGSLTLSGTNRGVGSSSIKQDPNMLLTLDPSFINCSLEEIFYSDPIESINTLSTMLPPSPIPVATSPLPSTTVPKGKSKSLTSIKKEDQSCITVSLQEPVKVSDFSPEWDFIDGGAKILICLERPLQKNCSNPEGNDFFHRIFVQFCGGISQTLNANEQRVNVEKISDTVLRCVAPSATSTGEVSWFIGYVDLSTAPNQIIQLSTVQLFTYRNNQRNTPPTVVTTTSSFDVDPSLSSNTCNSSSKRARSPTQGQHIASFSSIRKQGKQEQMTSSKTATTAISSTGKVDLSSYAETELNERQCKIRVMERLSEVHRTISVLPLDPYFSKNPDMVMVDKEDLISTKENIETSEKRQHLEENLSLVSTPSPSAVTPMEVVVTSMEQETIPRPDTSGTTTNWMMTTDDTNVEQLSDQELENLSEKLLERVVQQLVTLAHTNVELLEELNSLDEAGLSLLHYVSFYNYTKLVPLLVSHGAQINQQSTQGYTSLHLAAGCGHFHVVQMLVKYDADLFITDFDGFTPADRAEKSGNQEVGAYLRQLMLVDPLSSLPSSGMRKRQPSTEYDEEYNNEMQDSCESSTASSTWSSVELNNFDQQEGFKVRSSSTSSLGGGVGGSNGGNGETKSSLQFAHENHEHNRKLLLGAFSTMSLHDKCALSLGISRDHHHTSGYGNKRRGSSVGDDLAEGNNSINHFVSSSSGNLCDSSLPLDRPADVKSVIAEDEESLNKLEAAMELMGPDEIQSLEEEAKVIQHNVRAWLLRRSVKNMRETTKKLQEVTKNISHNQQEQEQNHHKEETDELMRERAAVTVQAATRSMIARKSFLQTKNVTIKVQAATRGVLCRKNFARMKTHALASLVIQRNVREWLNKQETSKDLAQNENEEDLEPIQREFRIE